jgi:hypothetical protein
MSRDQLRPLHGSHPVSMKLRTEEFEAVQAYAARRQLSFSGAVRELIRSHPLVQLPPINRPIPPQS